MKVNNHDHTTQGLMSFISISEKKTNSETVKSAENSNHLVDVFNVEGTKWMTFFVLTYKLCERSEQTFALFLVDKNVPRTELALLSTAIRAHSIVGSFASGLALTTGIVNTSPITIIPFKKEKFQKDM